MNPVGARVRKLAVACVLAVACAAGCADSSGEPPDVLPEVSEVPEVPEAPPTAIPAPGSQAPASAGLYPALLDQLSFLYGLNDLQSVPRDEEHALIAARTGESSFAMLEEWMMELAPPMAAWTRPERSATRYVLETGESGLVVSSTIRLDLAGSFFFGHVIAAIGPKGETVVYSEILRQSGRLEYWVAVVDDNAVVGQQVVPAARTSASMDSASCPALTLGAGQEGPYATLDALLNGTACGLCKAIVEKIKEYGDTACGITGVFVCAAIGAGTAGVGGFVCGAATILVCSVLDVAMDAVFPTYLFCNYIGSLMTSDDNWCPEEDGCNAWAVAEADNSCDRCQEVAKCVKQFGCDFAQDLLCKLLHLDKLLGGFCGDVIGFVCNKGIPEPLGACEGLGYCGPGAGQDCDACNSEWDCASGNCVAYLGAWTCLPACQSDADCSGGETCNKAGNYCHPATATACFAGDVWAVDACGNYIKPQFTCGPNGVCIDGACKALGKTCDECDGPGDCLSGVCVKYVNYPDVKYCVPTCETGWDCPDDMACKTDGYCGSGPLQKSCHEGDVYWVDSCSIALSLAKNCKNDDCLNAQCGSGIKCGDNVCEEEKGEDCWNCPKDCNDDCAPKCGDGKCDPPAEDCGNCSDCKCGLDCVCEGGNTIDRVKLRRYLCADNWEWVAIYDDKDGWGGEFFGGTGAYLENIPKQGQNYTDIKVAKNIFGSSWQVRLVNDNPVDPYDSGTIKEEDPDKVTHIFHVKMTGIEGNYTLYLDEEVLEFTLKFFDCDTCDMYCQNKCAGGPPCNCLVEECPCGQTCLSGLCAGDPCLGKECGDDGCDGSCGECQAYEDCVDGICVCEPECEGKQCGGNGCGGKCGLCPAGTICDEKTFVCACMPQCDDRECGPDNCGDICGECAENHECEAGKCVYVPFCGDADCDAEHGETCYQCPEDCQSCCGNGQCEPNYFENCENCPGDCGICCPNDSCEGWFDEDCATCPDDCGACCPNGVCDDDKGEGCEDCPEDCDPCPSVCGENECEEGETCKSCPIDCGKCCGNGDCDEKYGETCKSCPEDCGICCSNGLCQAQYGENCDACPDDCGVCCPNGICNKSFGEDCETCEADCGVCPGCANGILDPEIGEECDDGNLENGDGCSEDCTKEIVKSGSLVISELMINPESFPKDDPAEWFELYNPEKFKIKLNGWVLEIQGSDQHVVKSGAELWIEPGGYFVMGNNADPDENGGVTIDYEYENFKLGNDGEAVFIRRPDAQKHVDDVTYVQAQVPEGASLSLHPEFLDHKLNDVAENWCPATTQMAGGDFGTPGKVNDPCFGFCGDGKVDEEEECDDGPGNSDLLPDACRTDCTFSKCGDGVVDDGEECDDGNTEPDDGCDGSCKVEAPEPVCGNGVVELENEDECDDGNTEPGDGCDQNCQIEGIDPQCADGECNGDETCENCPEDCGDCCGDGLCDKNAGEDFENCPEDCPKEAPGDILITEIMLNPQVVPKDDPAEWFEVRNMAATPIDMAGWTITDAGSDYHEIDPDTPLVVEPGQYLVFGRSASPDENGGIDVDYVMGDEVKLGNKGDEIIIVSAQGVELDQVWYDNETFPLQPGRSLVLHPGAYDLLLNDQAANWCPAPDSDLMDNGVDYGTPGQPNSSCTGSICGNGDVEEGEECDKGTAEEWACCDSELCQWQANCCGNETCEEPAESCMNCEEDCGECPCEPTCEGKECGDDGCEGSCGECDAGHECVDGACQPVAVEPGPEPDLEIVEQPDVAASPDVAAQPDVVVMLDATDLLSTPDTRAPADGRAVNDGIGVADIPVAGDAVLHDTAQDAAMDVGAGGGGGGKGSSGGCAVNGAAPGTTPRAAPTNLLLALLGGLLLLCRRTSPRRCGCRATTSAGHATKWPLPQ